MNQSCSQQLAGAFYGLQGIPVSWRERLAQRELIEGYAQRLFELQPGD